MKEVIQNLAGGRGKCVRSIHKLNVGLVKVEFGKIVLDPGCKIGKHGHWDEENWKHCEVYVTFSPIIWVNGWQRRISICRNAEHEAENMSEERRGCLHFAKVWWH